MSTLVPKPNGFLCVLELIGCEDLVGALVGGYDAS
jgi:hypothetical protein